VVDLCDSLAYDTHDLDDGLGVGLIGLNELPETEFWQIGAERAERRWPGIQAEQYRPAVVRALFEWQVQDLVTHTRERLAASGANSVADVRATPGLVGFSETVVRVKRQLQAFLHERVYRHPYVAAMAVEGQAAVRGLFEHYLHIPEALPPHHAARLQLETPARVVCDYLAGMTDPFAPQDFRRLSEADRPVQDL